MEGVEYGLLSKNTGFAGGQRQNSGRAGGLFGTTAQYYGLYEKGANEISFERAILIAKYYGVSLDYIAGLTNNKKGLASSDLTAEQQELLKLASELSDKDKKKITEALKRFLNLLN